ncbi:hypothetical protein ACLOJK_034138 [Asimina triloba]
MHLYRIMIGFLSKVKQVRNVELIEAEMEEAGFKLDLSIFNILLWEQGQQAEDLCEGLRSKGWRLDNFVYHTMMKIYKDSGNHSKVANVLSLMKEDGVEPTVSTMHMLMVSYGTVGQAQDAEVLNKLKLLGLDLSTVSYSSVIDAYLKNGDYILGIEKLQDTKKDGIELDCLIWTCFVRVASLCQNQCFEYRPYRIRYGHPYRPYQIYCSVSDTIANREDAAIG